MALRPGDARSSIFYYGRGATPAAINDEEHDVLSARGY
jgi:hypothetical protein